jgi:hypothetical protein
MRELIVFADDGAVQDGLRHTREAAEVSGRHADLRTFDIALWMAYRDNAASD